MKTKLEEATSLIQTIESIRKIPQYFFCTGINIISSTQLRENIIEFKKKNPKTNEIDFILESGGGQAEDAYRIIRTLRKNFTKVNVIIAFWAKSAATLLSLGATMVIMDEYAELGPLDTQIQVESEDKKEPEIQSALLDEHSLKRIEQRAQESLQTMFISMEQSKSIKISKIKLFEQLTQYIPEFYRPLISKIDPYQIGAKARHLALVERYAQRILINYNNLKRTERISLIDYLVNGCPDHGYIIDYDLIKLYLQNIKCAADISKPYNRILTKLSLLLVKSSLEYNGFVEKKSKVIKKQQARKTTPEAGK